MNGNKQVDMAKVFELYNIIDMEAKKYYQLFRESYKKDGIYTKDNSVIDESKEQMIASLLKQKNLELEPVQLLSLVCTLGAVTQLDAPMPALDFFTMISGGNFALSEYAEQYIIHKDEIISCLKKMSETI